MLNSIFARLRQRQAVRELSRLSDRSLHDLGIARTEIEAVAARAFSASRDTAATRRPQAGRLAASWAAQNRRALAA